MLRAGRRGLQMVLRLLAHNAEHWLGHPSQRLPARQQPIPGHHPQTIIRGLAGIITFTPAAITVTLEPPGQPRVTRALALLIDEIGTPRPSSPVTTGHHLPHRPEVRHLTPDAAGLPEIWGRDVARPNLRGLRRMPYACFSYVADTPRSMPFACFSYSADVPLDARKPDVAPTGLRRMPISSCFRY